MHPRSSFATCDTLFSSGIWSSGQTQLCKYIDYPITATTGETLWSQGKAGLKPLNVIYNPYICENVDINLAPFANFMAAINPLNWIFSLGSFIQNRNNGIQFLPAANPQIQSVKFHSAILSKVSIGQEDDINHHKAHYENWRTRPNRSKDLILYGVSRGTATTFCAFAREKYSEVKLVILEGAIDSIPNVLLNSAVMKVGKDNAPHLVRMTSNVLSFFTSYKPTGISPLACLDQYPENVPTVFITSKIDKVVPHENTRNIAQALAERGKNDVYLLVLENSEHPDYMYSNARDHHLYKCFIHAIYKHYGLHHHETLAEEGSHLIESCKLQARPLNVPGLN